MRLTMPSQANTAPEHFKGLRRNRIAKFSQGCCSALAERLLLAALNCWAPLKLKTPKFTLKSRPSNPSSSACNCFAVLFICYSVGIPSLFAKSPSCATAFVDSLLKKTLLSVQTCLCPIKLFQPAFKWPGMFWPKKNELSARSWFSRPASALSFTWLSSVALLVARYQDAAILPLSPMVGHLV